MLISDPDHGSEISMMLCERRGAGAGSLYLPFCIFSWGRSNTAKKGIDRHMMIVVFTVGQEEAHATRHCELTSRPLVFTQNNEDCHVVRLLVYDSRAERECRENRNGSRRGPSCQVPNSMRKV